MGIVDILKIASVKSVISDMMTPQYIYSPLDFEIDHS